MQQQQQSTLFPSLAYPFTNYLCIAFMLGILAIMSLTPDMRIAVYMIPAWVGCLSLAYWMKQRKHKAAEANLILNTDSSFK